MTAFDRAAVRKVLASRLPKSWTAWIEGTLDELEGCVQPQSIDRDTLERTLQAFIETRPPMSIRECADRILALLRPAEGIVLSHREAQTTLGWYADAWGDEIAPALYDKALARKLGDAS